MLFQAFELYLETELAPAKPTLLINALYTFGAVDVATSGLTAVPDQGPVHIASCPQLSLPDSTNDKTIRQFTTILRKKECFVLIEITVELLK